MKRQFSSRARWWRLGAFVLCASRVWATDGISVTGHWDGSSYLAKIFALSRFDIKDDIVVKITNLVPFTDRNPTTGGRNASINASGTHFAFYHYDGTKWHVSVMSLEGGKIYKFMEVPGPGKCSENGCDASHSLHWTSDGFVYYFKSQTELRRFHPANPSGDALVYNFPGSMYTVRFSSNADRLYSYEPRKWQRTSNGYTQAGSGGGCGVAISPSGKYLHGYTGTSHTTHNMATWDNTIAPIPSFTDQEANQWALNTGSGDTILVCTEGPRPIGKGGKTVGPGWSVNADRWLVCLIGTDGRSLECGSNQIIYDWEGHRAINVTRCGRMCGGDSVLGKSCNIYNAQVPGGVDNMHAETGSFWVATIAEVNENLRCYVAQREEWKSYWNTVLEGQSAQEPLCSTVGAISGRSMPAAGDGIGAFAMRRAAIALVDIRGRTLTACRRGSASGTYIAIEAAGQGKLMSIRLKQNARNGAQ